jgi:zinc protease
MARRLFAWQRPLLGLCASALLFPAAALALESEVEGEGEGTEAQDAPASAEGSAQLSIPFEKYKLSNGLEVMLHQDARTAMIAVSVWYHVGAFDEPPGRSGFAHLFEHLMFQGSEHVKGDQHFAYLEAAGASVRNGMVNGTTNFDRTNYFEVLPKNELELALWLESDRMGWLGSAITQAKLDEQRAVVKNERLQSLENRPYGLADEALWQRIFPKEHPYYGKVIGSLKDLDAATMDDVRAFYDTYYAPSNATLAIAGDFERKDAKRLVDKYFATIPTWKKPEKRQVATPRIDSPIRVDFEEPIGKLAKVKVSYLTPAFFAEGDAEMDILAGVLTMGKSSRLVRALQYDEELVQSVHAYQGSMESISLFTVEAVVKDGTDPETVLSAIQAQLEFLADLPPDEREVKRVQNLIETQKLFGLQKIGGFSGKAEQLQSYNHYLGDPDWLASDLARYRQVTPETLMAAVKTHLAPEKRAVLVARPKRAAAAEEGTQP